MIYLILNFNTFINVFITLITHSRSSLFTFWHTHTASCFWPWNHCARWRNHMHIPDDCETAMVELTVRSCWLLSYVDYGDIWLYVPTLHKVVFKLSNQHYQQDYLVLINHLDRDLFLLEVISLELSLDFTYLRQVLIQLPSRFWIFSDLIHLFSIISNEIESDSRFIKVSIENIM